jgi:hypothetical protein
MKKRDDDGNKGRLPYEKPRLRSFPLAAGEVLAKGCKLAGPSTGFQGTGCVSGGCFELGS